jgi:hypothetical protein
MNTASAALIVNGLMELGKLSLTAYFRYMEIAGVKAEEVDKVYQEKRAEFYARKPEDLPKV